MKIYHKSLQQQHTFHMIYHGTVKKDQDVTLILYIYIYILTFN